MVVVVIVVSELWNGSGGDCGELLNGRGGDEVSELLNGSGGDVCE
jgi:hypothetical protein